MRGFVTSTRKGARRAKEFVGRQAHAARGVAAGGVDDVEAVERDIRVDAHLRLGAEGADAARGVADERLHLVARDHLRLRVKRVAEFPVVDLDVARGEHQDRTLVREKGHGLGDAGGFAAELLGRKLHRGGGFGEGVHAVGESEFFEMGVGDVEGHGGSDKRMSPPFSYDPVPKGTALRCFH